MIWSGELGEAIFQKLESRLMIVNKSGEILCRNGAMTSIDRVNDAQSLQELGGASASNWSEFATESVISGGWAQIPDLLGEPAYSVRISALDHDHFLVKVLDVTDVKKEDAVSPEISGQGVSSKLVIEALKYQKQFLSEQKKSNTDQLTGIPNRRQFEANFSESLREFEESGTVFSLLIMDVDFFKKVNDTYGHAKGDQVLVELGEILQCQFHNGCIAHRIGGEEFAVILNGYSSQDAIKVADAFRQRTQDARLGEIDVTISIGVGTCDHVTWNRSLLLEAADCALYEAKKQGRNRVIHVKELSQFANLHCA